MVHIKEGGVYKFGEVELKGELADSRNLIKAGGFKTGETADFRKSRRVSKIFVKHCAAKVTLKPKRVRIASWMMQKRPLN